jgi:hypothetical protein
MFRSPPRFRDRAVLLAWLLPCALSAADLPLGFNRDIRPILADHCFNCHGPDAGTRKGGLRLDERGDALRGGKSGLAALVPGDPGQSELLLRVRSPHDDEVMPPVDKKEKLKAADISKLERWIKEGAVYQPHWAFAPPEKPPVVETVKSAGKAPLDTWVSAWQKAAGLIASPEAEPEVLVRRVWLDLVGLPPSLSDVDAFVAASKRDRDGAYRALVDQLLASPRYGEKWARHWLDVARYADSDGYEKDVPRQQWAWRDWVIRALNEDKPYDRFVIEQVAGDLLVDQAKSLRERQDLVVATGFLRNSMVSEEGAIIAEQYRKEAMFDRMDCLGKAVVGVTLQCAQCHTHKFDPVTHDEYYQLFAAIDNTYEATSRVYSPEKLEQIEALLKAVSAVDERREGHRCRIGSSSWTRGALDPCLHQPLLEGTGRTPSGMGGRSQSPGSAARPLHSHPGIPTHHGIPCLHRTRPAGTRIGSLRLEALTHGDLIFGGPGRSIDGLLRRHRRGRGVAGRRLAKEWKTHALNDAKADFESPVRPMGPHFAKERRRQTPAWAPLRSRLMARKRPPGARTADQDGATRPSK